MRFAIIAAMLLPAVERVYGCATCAGPADAPQTLGMNAAILTLFGVLIVVGAVTVTLVGAVAWRIAHHQPAPRTEQPAPSLYGASQEA